MARLGLHWPGQIRNLAHGTAHRSTCRHSREPIAHAHVTSSTCAECLPRGEKFGRASKTSSQSGSNNTTSAVCYSKGKDTKRWNAFHSHSFQNMPHDPDPPPAKKFKPGSVFFRFDKNKPGMLLPRKENVTAAPIDVQRKRLPIYQAKPQLLNQLRQLHSAILIGEQQLAAASFHLCTRELPVRDSRKGKSPPDLSPHSCPMAQFHGHFVCLF